MSKISSYSLWLALALLHTWLFFEQSAGFNVLAFSLLSVVLITVHHRLQYQKMWWVGVCVHLITAVGVAWHGTVLASILYYCSAFVLAGLALSVESSLPVALLNGFSGSLLAAFVAHIPDMIGDIKQEFPAFSTKAGSSRKRVSLYVAPLSVTAVFYFLYCIANPDFLLEIKLPDWEFNLSLLFYTLFGFIVVSPFVIPWGFKGLAEWDLSKPDILTRVRPDEKGTARGLVNENRQGVIMFGMLNLLLVLFLIFNILQIFVPSLNYTERSHSEQVHQGFETLIISIVVAIVLIMYYFRGSQNFFLRNRQLILLATAWIFLNALLAIFTCYKNVLYVDAFGLTFKRIWVFIGLMLTLAGLGFTLYKIKHLRTNWYLLRQNTWVLYFVLALYTTVDWDRLITWYNPNYAQNLDMEYILELGDTSLPYLKQLTAGDAPRFADYKGRVFVKISSVYLPDESWKSQTLDKLWLKEELRR